MCVCMDRWRTLYGDSFRRLSVVLREVSTNNASEGRPSRLVPVHFSRLPVA